MSVGKPAPRDWPDLADALCNAARLFGERQWCLATSGNFSVRAGAEHCMITRSGTDKAALGPDDLMICSLDGAACDPALVPSAELALHLALYRHDAAISAVLHTHSVAATVLSRRAADVLEISGFEMQKALPGVLSHEDPVRLPVFDNSQDMPGLARALRHELATARRSVPAFLLRGHGLYAWGADLDAARRHVEGLEFLLACLMQEHEAQTR
ncbi:MAG: methylthioribulose 1-phosphate dehydratase [Woeseiaceae bacterium]